MNHTPTFAEFFAAWELFRLPVLAGTLSGTLLGVLGVYVVLRRLVFLTAAISQAAGLGVALAFYAQIHLGAGAALASPMLGAILLTAGTVGVAGSERARGARTDSLLGFVYLVGAAGSLAIGTRIAHELHDIETLLFGSAVAVLPESFAFLATVTASLLALHLWWRRGFTLVSFDPDGARVRGLPVRVIEIGLFGSLALAVSASTRVLGALPTFAFSVLPALAAVRWSRNVDWALGIGAALGAASGFGGYLVAFRFELPVGAAQTLVGAALVLVAEISRRAVARRRRPSVSRGV